METTLLPVHSDELPPEPVAAPLAAAGTLCLMALLWLALYLVVTPLARGELPGMRLPDANSLTFTPLPVNTRLPHLLVAVNRPQTKMVESTMNEWEEGRQHAQHIAGALVEDEVQGVLLKMQLMAETGRFIGRLVKVE